jgi:nucleoside-diphosphate-sugar epimerase
VTRALVIGGAGFIGTAACKELMRRGVETIAAGRKDRPYGTFTSYVAFDCTDATQVKRTVESTQPDVVLDLAGGHLDVAVERYVLVSCAPVALPEGTVVRAPAVFGAADPSLRIVAYIQRVADGGPVLVPEETYETPLGLAWNKDVGYACALACDLRKDTRGRSYDVSFESLSIRDLVEGIARALGVQARLHPIAAAEMPDGASPYAPAPHSVDTARKDLGFEPSALEDALAETLAWYRVARPSHSGYANRAAELSLAGGG